MLNEMQQTALEAARLLSVTHRRPLKEKADKYRPIVRPRQKREVPAGGHGVFAIFQRRK